MQSFMMLLIFLREAPFIMLSLYITAKVAGKPVFISEASIRSDLLFDDADGIDSLPNQAIFDDIQLMGYERDLTVLTFNKALFSPQWRHLDAKKKFVMYPRFISIFLDKHLVNVPVPLDHFPVIALTIKVISFMVKKGCVEGPIVTSCVTGIRLYNMYWSMVIFFLGVCSSNTDCTACSSVAIPFPLPSTTRRFWVILEAAGSRKAKPPTRA
ncbi:hypothetical protein Tco_1290176 [Tanacetum coccineum]